MAIARPGVDNGSTFLHRRLKQAILRLSTDNATRGIHLPSEPRVQYDEQALIFRIHLGVL